MQQNKFKKWILLKIDSIWAIIKLSTDLQN